MLPGLVSLGWPWISCQVVGRSDSARGVWLAVKREGFWFKVRRVS